MNKILCGLVFITLTGCCGTCRMGAAPVSAGLKDTAASSQKQAPKENGYPQIDAKMLEFDAHLVQLRKTYSTVPENHKNKEWVKSELTYMASADHYAVNFASVVFPDYVDPASPEVAYYMKVFMPRLNKLLASNAEMMKSILKTYNWITISEFGKDFDTGAWVLVQHADFDRPFQKQVLGILENLLKTNETSKTNYSFMHDRLTRADGKLQRYGTQGDCKGPMNWQPFEIDDAANVDKRRSEMGMDPLAKQIELNNPRCGK